MEIEKQVNESDSDGSDIIFKRKICIHLEKKTKFSQCFLKNLLKIFIFFIFGHLQGVGLNSKFA